jgi:hypothetical protein
VRQVRKRSTTEKGKNENGVDMEKISNETRTTIQAARKAKKEECWSNKTVTFKDEVEYHEEPVQKNAANGGQFGSGVYTNDTKRKERCE